MAILKGNNLVTFEQRQEVGTEGEEVFCEYLRKQGLDPIPIKQQFKPFDVFEAISGTTYEVKTCLRAWDYGKTLVELRRVINGVWTDYGLLHTRADAWAFVTHKDILVIATEDLKNLILRENSFREETDGESDNARKIRIRVDLHKIIERGQQWER